MDHMNNVPPSSFPAKRDARALQGRSFLVVAPSAYHPSGVAVWLQHLSDALRMAGAKCVVALPSSRLHDLDAYRRHYPSLDTVGLVNRTGSQEGRVRAITRVLVEQAPDMVLGADIADAYLAVNRARQATKRPMHVAMTCHGLVPGIFADAHAYHDVLDGVICVNRLTQSLMVAIAGMSVDRSFWAPCGAGHSSVPRQVHERLPTVGEGRLRIAWVGRMEQLHKRVLDLVAIVQQLSRSGLAFECVVAGSGSKAGEVQALLRPWIEAGTVRWLGVLAPQAVRSLVWAHVDVLLLTSETEASPLVVWEAMAEGVAIVSSQWVGSGLEATLRHGVNCLLYPIGDASLAVSRLREVTDAKLRQSLVDAAYVTHSARYSAAASARRWLEVLGCVMSVPARPGLRGDPGGISPHGRLDHLLGVSMAERVRVYLDKSFVHQHAGVEWPWHNHPGLPEEQFMALARQWDATAVSRET